MYLKSIQGMKAPTTQGHIQLQHVLKMEFGLRDYHLEQVREIINKADYHSPIYEKLKDIEAQISTGKVQYVKTYVVKTLQNEFGNVDG